MPYKGEASDPAGELVHSALLYASDDEFMDVALPFVEEGLAEAEPTLVAVQRRNVDNLRFALGGKPDGVSLLSVEEWYESSARTRNKFVKWAAGRIGRGRVRVMGEPPWAVENDAQVRDWARHESVFNLAFAGMPVTFICPYDTRLLPPEIVRYAHSTHPEIASADGLTESDGYEDPVEFCDRLDSAIPRPAGPADSEIRFGLSDLPMVRRTVAAVAEEMGFSRSRVEELVLAVNETATNAVVHGSPPAGVRIWRGEGELVFEVSDAGEGISDVLAGQFTPPTAGVGGRGLWLTRLVCDAVEIRNEEGCTVSIHATRPSVSLVA